MEGDNIWPSHCRQSPGIKDLYLSGKHPLGLQMFSQGTFLPPKSLLQVVLRLESPTKLALQSPSPSPPTS